MESYTNRIGTRKRAGWTFSESRIHGRKHGAADEGHGAPALTGQGCTLRCTFQDAGQEQERQAGVAGHCVTVSEIDPQGPGRVAEEQPGRHHRPGRKGQDAEEGHIDKCTVTAIRGGASHHRASLHVARGAPMVR